MKINKLWFFVFLFEFLLFIPKSFLYSYISFLNITHKEIQIYSSCPKIWSKISNNNYYYSYLYRFEDTNNIIKINLNDNDFDHIEFYYNIYYKSDLNRPEIFINDIIVLIEEDENYFTKLSLNKINGIGRNKINLDISNWKDKKIKINIIVKQSELIGTEIYGIFPFNKKNSPNRVMLISLDTVGAKHMSLYGYKKIKTTPGLDNIIKKEDNVIIFSNAYAQAWWTLPAHATMFSGLYPFQHDMNNGNIELIFNENIKTLHQILQEGGIYTYHSISHSRIADKLGYNRGVVLYSDHSKLLDGDKADNTIQTALEVINDNLDKDILLFLHLFDAHEPYTEYPKNYKQLSPDVDPIDYDPSFIEFDPKDINNMNGYDPRNRLINKQKYEKEIEEKIKNIERAYDLGLCLLDQKIYGFFEQLKKLNLWETFYIIIVGDHGEEFFEHAGRTHTSLYNDNIRVPLLIKFKKTSDKKINLTKSKFINSTNIEAHIATFWTILDIFNLNNIHNKNPRRKYSLLNKSINNKGVFSEFFPDCNTVSSINDTNVFYQAAFLLDNFKLILTTYLKNINFFQLNNEYFELYNVLQDSEEKCNLIDNKKYQKVAKKMKKYLLKRIKREWKIKFKAINKSQMSKEEIEKLRSLGYIK